MYVGSLLRLEGSINAVKRHLQTSEALRGLVANRSLTCRASTPCFDVATLADEPPDTVEWRIIDHCSAVTRLYALYEQFAHELIREYVTFLEGNFRFNELEPEFKTYYRAGLGRILEKKDGPRYGALSLETLIENFHLALAGDDGYRLEPAALLIQEQNLRLPELSRLFKNCGIEGVQGWVAGHPDMETFFKDQNRVAAGPENELARLIDYRNEAAHGGQSVDDVVGLEVLQEFSDFTFRLCQVLAERAQLALLKKAEQKQLAVHHGSVTELRRQSTVIIAPMVGDLRIGQVIYLVGQSHCSRRTIISIRLDDVDKDRISTTEATEIGLGLDGRGKRGAKIVSMVLPEQLQAD
jgi:hypothetical protein